MSDRIVVMSEGRIQQLGTPEDIYNEPKNAFVADFIGESNIFNGIMTGKLRARFCGGEFECVDDIEEGTHITAVVRPEDVEITPPEEGTIRGIVTVPLFSRACIMRSPLNPARTKWWPVPFTAPGPVTR